MVINNTQIQLDLNLNVALTFCSCTFQRWFTLNDHLLNQTCRIHLDPLLSQAVKSQLRSCCGCLLMDCNVLRCISSAESLSNCFCVREKGKEALTMRRHPGGKKKQRGENLRLFFSMFLLKNCDPLLHRTHTFPHLKDTHTLTDNGGG